MNSNLRIYVAGHHGMVGSAIMRRLQGREDVHIIARSHKELDLTDQGEVRDFFSTEKIDQVYLAAAKVGGIYANDTYPAEFIYQNLMMETNVIHEAWRAQVKRLLFLGSSCIYPKLSQQPITEEALLTGPLEPTNEPYAIAKIAGIKLCESYNRQYGTDYRSVMPTNLYGPGDTYDVQNGHVIPALIRRFHEAMQRSLPEVNLWGSGQPRREFLYVDDLAAACVRLMSLPKEDYFSLTPAGHCHLNVGVDEDISIIELAELIKAVVGYAGEIRLDLSKPDGTPKKLMTSARVRLSGWAPVVPLKEGLELAYSDFLQRA